GTAQLCTPYGVVREPTSLKSRRASDLLADAERWGVSALDTAPAYGDAEKVIGRFGSRLAVHTKLDPALSPSVSVSRSLARLKRATIDLLYVHDHREILQAHSRVIEAAYRHVGRDVHALGASVYDA